MTETLPKNLDEQLRISKTVYSWVMPETEALIREVQSDPYHQNILQSRHREAWTGKQDVYHEEFFEAWGNWASGDIYKPTGGFMYPTAGSSEAIRESLAQMASLAKYSPHLGVPTIHVFKGEYEGYRALAEPYGITVVEHSRNNWREAIHAIGKEPRKGRGQRFYISHPSSIDGNLWREFSSFLNTIGDATELKVMLDLCYIGCVPKGQYPCTPQVHKYVGERIPANHDAVDTVFFSLSKVFGLYYHRIGGMITHTEHPGLWGNKWFKNLSSLYLGTQFMNRYSPFELPNKYRSLQEAVVEDLRADDGGKRLSPSMGSDVKPSDVFLLAYQSTAVGDLPRRYERASGKNRYCLTQRMYDRCMEQGLYDTE